MASPIIPVLGTLDGNPIDFRAGFGPPPPAGPIAPIAPANPSWSRRRASQYPHGQLSSFQSALDNPASAGYDAAMAEVSSPMVQAPTTTFAPSTGILDSLTAWAEANPVIAILGVGVIVYLLAGYSSPHRR